MIYFTNKLKAKKLKLRLNLAEADRYSVLNSPPLTKDDVVIMDGALRDNFLLSEFNKDIDNRPLLITMTDRYTAEDSIFGNFSFVLSKSAATALAKDNFESLRELDDLYSNLTQNQKKTHEIEKVSMDDIANIYSDMDHYPLVAGGHRGEGEEKGFEIYYNSASKQGFKYYAVYLNDFSNEVSIYSINTDIAKQKKLSSDNSVEQSDEERKAEKTLWLSKLEGEKQFLSEHKTKIKDAIVKKDLNCIEGATIKQLSFNQYALFMSSNNDIRFLKESKTEFKTFSECYLYKKSDIDEENVSDEYISKVNKFLEMLFNIVSNISSDWNSFKREFSNIVFSLKRNEFVKSKMKKSANNYESFEVINEFLTYMYDMQMDKETSEDEQDDSEKADKDKFEFSIVDKTKTEWISRYFFQQTLANLDKNDRLEIYYSIRSFLDSSSFSSLFEDYKKKAINIEENYTLDSAVEEEHSITLSHIPEQPHKLVQKQDSLQNNFIVLEAIFSLDGSSINIYQTKNIIEMAVGTIYNISNEFVSEEIAEEFIYNFLADSSEEARIRKTMILVQDVISEIALEGIDNIEPKFLEKLIKNATNTKSEEFNSKRASDSTVEHFRPKCSPKYEKDGEIGIPKKVEELVDAIQKIKDNPKAKDRDVLDVIKKHLAQERIDRGKIKVTLDEAADKILAHIICNLEDI